MPMILSFDKLLICKLQNASFYIESNRDFKKEINMEIYFWVLDNTLFPNATMETTGSIGGTSNESSTNRTKFFYQVLLRFVSVYHSVIFLRIQCRRKYDAQGITLRKIKKHLTLKQKQNIEKKYWQMSHIFQGGCIKIICFNMVCI